MPIERTDEPVSKQINFHFDNLYFQEPRLFPSFSLYQIGDLSCKGGCVIREHQQICYEISYIVSGKGAYTINGKRYAVRKGDIILNVPGEKHACIADDIDPFRYFYMGFDFVDSGEKQHSLTPIKRIFNLTEAPVAADKLAIDAPFMRLFHELINLNSYSTLMIETYMRQIIVLAYRNFHENWTVQYAPRVKEDKSKMTVYEVVHYIDVNLPQITKLSRIADDLHYDYAYLSHIFKEVVGVTIKEYYDNKRFEKAVEMLRDETWTMTEIAGKLQYQSIHAFSKAFRKKFGIPPTEYRSLSAGAAPITSVDSASDIR